MESCPCCSGKAYSECCEPFIRNQKQALTTEELMRSRYSAYAKCEVEHIVATTHPDQMEYSDERSIRSWSKNSTWEGLEIVSAKAGGPDDQEGEVEFIAHYSAKNGMKKVHHELALFKKVDGAWRFFDGKPVPQKTFVREDAKIGRNEPCPCGSGKKYKLCCG